MHQASPFFHGRFLDGQLRLLLSPGAEPGPGYCVALHDGRIWRNGEHVGRCEALTWDRHAMAWWVEYRSWRGSPLDHPTVVGASESPNSERAS